MAKPGVWSLWSFGLCLLTAIPASVAAQELAAQTVDADYPGVITLAVDASDVDRRIQRVKQHIPVQAGPLTLWYPQWIPGNHAPTGPINQIAGLIFRGNGQPLAWQRDSANMHAFHLQVPQGVQVLEVEFQYLSPTSESQGRVAMTPQMLSLQWHRVLLYPAGVDARRIRVAASLTLPEGWRSATALERGGNGTSVVNYPPVSLMQLIDSPVYAGRYFRDFDLATGANSPPVRLHAIADAPEQLQATPAMLEAHRALVRQADQVFGPRPFAHYDFLLALSDTFTGIGLEHHQSSENGTYPGYLRGDAPFIDNDLLPHEYVHAWSGKFRRPASSWVTHYNAPMRNDLLWVYEGQTQYWAVVLAARSGLWTPAQARAVLADTVATSEQRRGRQWRNLQDTVHEGIIEFNDAPQAWADWQRAYDFYAEGSLLWLDVDARLRELSGGRRSLDDFARRFHQGYSADKPVSLYGFEDVVQALDAIQPEDWPAFLRERLDGLGTQASPQGLARSGWRVVYDDQPNIAIVDAESANDNDDFRYSLGLKIGHDGTIEEVSWESPAFAAQLARDMQLVAVNGTAYSSERLKNAIIAAKSAPQAIELLVKQGDSYRSTRIDYHDGLRYPHLQRIDGKPDLLSKILAARK